MKLTVTESVSLDGVMQGLGGPDEDRRGGFERGGWALPLVDGEVGAFLNDVYARADAFLFGRRTYEIFAGFWPKVTDPNDPIASRLNSLPKYVPTRTLEEVSWAGTTLLKGDLAEEIAELKAKPGRELQVHGSGSLAQALMQHGLVDEYRLLTYPVILGAGRRLFGDGAKPAALRFVDHRTTSAGVSIDVYQPVGEPTYGSFGLDEEQQVVRGD
jgi:dihydrofolate reductase